MSWMPWLVRACMWFACMRLRRWRLVRRSGGDRRKAQKRQHSSPASPATNDSCAAVVGTERKQQRQRISPASPAKQVSCALACRSCRGFCVHALAPSATRVPQWWGQKRSKSANTVHPHPQPQKFPAPQWRGLKRQRFTGVPNQKILCAMLGV